MGCWRVSINLTSWISNHLASSSSVLSTYWKIISIYNYTKQFISNQTGLIEFKIRKFLNSLMVDYFRKINQIVIISEQELPNRMEVYVKPEKLENIWGSKVLKFQTVLVFRGVSEKMWRDRSEHYFDNFGLRIRDAPDHEWARHRPGLTGMVIDATHVDVCLFVHFPPARLFDTFACTGWNMADMFQCRRIRL